MHSQVLLIKGHCLVFLKFIVLREVSKSRVLDRFDECLITLLVWLAGALGEGMAEVVLENDLVGRADLAASEAHHVGVCHFRYLVFIFITVEIQIQKLYLKLVPVSGQINGSFIHL